MSSPVSEPSIQCLSTKTPLASPAPNPCMWKSCRAGFSELVDLQTHIHIAHISTNQSTTPICLWNGCLKTTAGRRDLIHHLYKHIKNKSKKRSHSAPPRISSTSTIRGSVVGRNIRSPRTHPEDISNALLPNKDVSTCPVDTTFTGAADVVKSARRSLPPTSRSNETSDLVDEEMDEPNGSSPITDPSDREYDLTHAEREILEMFDIARNGVLQGWQTPNQGTSAVPGSADHETVYVDL